MNMHPLRAIAHATTRIETIYPDGSVGHGTGFFMMLAENGQEHIPAIITNKHVIDGGTEYRFPISTQDASGKPTGHQIIHLNASELPIVRHPEQGVDLAAIPIAPIIQLLRDQHIQPLLAPLPSEFIADQAYLSQLYPLETVTMIGYPNAIWDQINNQPIIRQGVIATNPALNYQGRAEFLCDIAAFPGSSGSPLMLINHGSYVTPDGNMAFGSRDIKIVNIPTTQRAIVESKIPNNLGVMIKAYKIRELEATLRTLV
jgi:hypothetical protein